MIIIVSWDGITQNFGTLARKLLTILHNKNWENENNWLVPPVNLVVRAIRHLIACIAFGVLVVPNWPSAVFLAIYFLMIHRWYVKDVLLFHECTDILIQGNNKTCLFDTKYLTSGILAVKLDARS